MKLAVVRRKAEVVAEEAAESAAGSGGRGVVVTAALAAVSLAAVVVALYAVMAVDRNRQQVEWLVERLQQVEQRTEALETRLQQAEHSREKRQAITSNMHFGQQHKSERNAELENLSEDGIPILEKRPNGRRGRKKGGVGLRVYDAWFQHKRENEIPNDPRVVWSHPTDAPIRAHHRKSAAWVNGRDEEDYSNFAGFGETVYSDKSKPIKTNSESNSINFSRNRAKVTNIKEFQSNRGVEVTSTEAAVTTPETAISITDEEELNEHMRLKLDRKKARNRAAVRSGERRGRRRHKNRSGLRSGRSGGISGRPAIHMIGTVRDTDSEDYDGSGRLKVVDGVFRDWSPSRWARRMRLDKQFPFKDGKLGVSSPGVYFVYAQINYLDEHDVNAFQIYVNDDPFLLCTSMTHTPHFTTKANTCYTGGVIFLEQGDQVFIRNLEANRFAVLLPSHSFFGLVQLSQAGI